MVRKSGVSTVQIVLSLLFGVVIYVSSRAGIDFVPRTLGIISIPNRTIASIVAGRVINIREAVSSGLNVNKTIEDISKENADLKAELLKIKKEYLKSVELYDMSLCDMSIVGRTGDSMLYLKNSKDCTVQKGDTVGWNDMLVGTVEEVSANVVVVDTIYSGNKIYKVRIIAEGQSVSAILEGGSGSIKINNIPSGIEIETGAIVILEGEKDGVEWNIGSIKEINSESKTSVTSATLKDTISINNINYVQVKK